MSWGNAKIDAEKWLAENYPGTMEDHIISREELAAQLPFEGEYGEMVLRAAVRLLRRQGVKIIRKKER